MKQSPRVLLTIDYEPWFALSRKYDRLNDLQMRRDLDHGFTKDALSQILELLSGKAISFFLVGEIAEWYPQVPAAITAAGHELGFHCQLHRSLTNPDELELDLVRSRSWRQQYHVTGYRAPMVGLGESGYPLLAKEGFSYSSSIYAPTGSLQRKSGILEIPVSTFSLQSRRAIYNAPRPFNIRLLLDGEIPFGSSFMSGLTPGWVLKRVESELKAGLSPVLILHPYELIKPERFLKNLLPDLVTSPQLLPFTRNKLAFLTELLKNFPVGRMDQFFKESM